MFFSDKDKKPSGSKVLTEAEIKKKLYGDFETTSGAGQFTSHEYKTSASSFEAGAVFHQPRSTNKSTAKSDTFLPPRFSPSSLTPKGSHKADLPLKNSFENKLDFSSAQSKVVFSAKVFLGFLTGVVWKFSAYFIQGLDFFLRMLDPRKPQSRKFMYSITACILVFVLFLGVFKLNAQRKRAMLGEVSAAAPLQVAVTPVVTKHKVAMPHIASHARTTVVPEGELQTQKEESQEKILKKLEKEQGLENFRAETPLSKPTVPNLEGRFVIQVATYGTVEDAGRVVQSLAKAGFKSFYKKQIRNSTGHAFYPVYLGRFESFVSAQQTLTKFRKASIARPFQDSFVRALLD